MDNGIVLSAFAQSMPAVAYKAVDYDPAYLPLPEADHNPKERLLPPVPNAGEFFRTLSTSTDDHREKLRRVLS